MTGMGYAGDISPQDAWKVLETDPRSALIDVRTQAEWAYVGVPNLAPLGKQAVFVEWALFPNMNINPHFAEQLAAKDLERDAPLLFLCRSGVRSRAAAITMTASGFSTCFNVATGFEGDHDPERHRGILSGWKVAGLPWVQG